MDPDKGIRDREVILDALGNPQVRGGLTWPAQRYTAILGEGTHLDHALAGIRLSGGDPADLINSFKSFGKHGELSNRFAFGYFPAMKHHAVERFTHTFAIYEADSLPDKHIVLKSAQQADGVAAERTG